jgi:hypothetical protein
MVCVQLMMNESVSQTVLNFLKLLPSNEVQIGYPECDRQEILDKLEKAESDVAQGKVHSLASVKSLLLG